jgi:hypothetical protein
MAGRNRPSGIRCWLLLPCLVALLQTGCTSAITTAYLRDAWLDGGDHAQESAAIAAADDDTRDDVAADAGSESGRKDLPEVDASRRAAAIEEAVARLSKLGTLDETARATLIDTLRRTQQEDWPVVIEAFAETLAAAAPPAVTAAHVVAKAATDKPAAAAQGADAFEAAVVATTASADPPTAGADDVTATSNETAAAPAPEPPQRAAENASGPLAGDAGSGPSPDPGAPPVASLVESPTLAVQNASFASRVRAWGDLDRFSASRFRPGQEVIVYFELENLSAGESPTGHTTCIDTVIKLVGPAGEPVHEWSFEPIAETLKSRRRDYFARYVVRMPETCPPGGCRLEVTVSDTLAGTTAKADLPFELAAE